MNREERRKMSRKDLQKAKQDTQNRLAAILLSVWIDVLWDDVEPEAIEDWVTRVVEKYNSIDDEKWDEYQNEVFEKTGIGIIRTKEDQQ